MTTRGETLVRAYKARLVAEFGKMVERNRRDALTVIDGKSDAAAIVIENVTESTEKPNDTSKRVRTITTIVYAVGADPDVIADAIVERLLPLAVYRGADMQAVRVAEAGIKWEYDDQRERPGVAVEITHTITYRTEHDSQTAVV